MSGSGSVTGLGLRKIAKEGWKPEGKAGPGSKESWRGDFKGIGQVAGWVGKGKSPAEAASEHQARPLSSLKDPSAFAPPPKHINYHGPAAVPNALTPDRAGLGAPLSQAEIQEAREVEEAAEARTAAEEEAEHALAPRVPYRADTTGLSTSHLPKPPLKSVDYEQDNSNHHAPAPSKAPKPSLPPRLPPRQSSNPGRYAPLPPPTYTAASQEPPVQQKDYLNKGSLDRLSKAGVSVPGFEIGKPASNNPWRDEPTSPARTESTTTTLPSSNSRGPQLSDLQNRFSRMSTSSPQPEAPSRGTSFAQKQAALKTASSFRNDPSTVSLSDARTAASTANNFRERHGDQVATGWKAASGANQKYGIANKFNSYTSGGGAALPSPIATEPQVASSRAAWESQEADSGSIAMRDKTAGPTMKKKPPPPPPKKKELSANTLESPLEPPPVPLASRPRY
ncbi:MAG: hypothetical protein M1827_003368 [Pycnora praestabilis]|nr:MAG: hypothetical protein M1827_003368 [Pycnora praestabilis]